MIEQVDSNIYRIEIPLPQSPLKATNSYFIRGIDRNLLIDTGFNRRECREAMEDAQRLLGFKMDNTDLFLTHIHADHTGLAGTIECPGMFVYAGGFYADYLRDPQVEADETEFSSTVIQGGLLQMGVPADDPMLHPGNKFAPAPVKNLKTIHDGDILRVGGLQLQCIAVPGHAPDEFCLYDAMRQILFTGDHILGSITPNNTLWEEPWTAQKDYLGLYLENLDKVDSLPIALGLPGHRAIIEDCHERIAELHTHHKKRLELVLKILSDGKPHTGAQVAAQMRWDIRAKSWEDFPSEQKFFATGEALSHLTHLIFKGYVKKELQDGVVRFTRVK